MRLDIYSKSSQSTSFCGSTAACCVALKLTRMEPTLERTCSLVEDQAVKGTEGQLWLFDLERNFIRFPFLDCHVTSPEEELCESQQGQLQDVTSCSGLRRIEGMFIHVHSS